MGNLAVEIYNQQFLIVFCRSKVFLSEQGLHKGLKMAKTQLLDIQRSETSPADVLFVTDQLRIPPQIRKLMNENDLAWVRITIAEFFEQLDRVGVIGTVVIDTSQITRKQLDKLCQIVRELEEEMIATILLNNYIEFPLDKFKLATLFGSASFDEMWGRIEANVAYRRSLMTEQPADEAELQEQDVLAEDTAEQLKMAGMVQRDFLPARLPNDDNFHWAAFFQPASWVSGDIYDVTRLDEQHIGFYVADAVGHSMPAALLTMFLKQAIVMRQTIGNDYRIFSPQDVIGNLNLRMTDQHLNGCLFATCCYCLLNIRTRQLTYVRAGHPYPVLIRRGQKPEQLESRGGLIGIFEDNDFEQKTVQLERGDKIFLYSDGAESLVGKCNTEGQFVFAGGFRSIMERSVEQMVEEFGCMSRQMNVPSAEVDDITAVGLEVL